jgi:hypothetical protein
MEGPSGGDMHLSERLLADSGAQQVEAAMNGEIIVDPLQAGHGLRGESQAAQYRDTPFAVGFMVQLAMVFFLAIFWGLGSLKQEETISTDDETGTDTLSLWGFFFLLFLVSTSSIGIAAMSLDFMTTHAEHLMQAALMVSCVVLGAVVVLLFANDSSGFGFCWLFVLICTGLYAYSVQRRIPFASANLRTALSAIQMNYGVCMLAYAVAAVANLWVVIWLLAFLGVAFRSSSCTDGSCEMHMNPVAFFVLLLSYFWTSQVLQVSGNARSRPSHASCISNWFHSVLLLSECDSCHRQWCDWNVVVCSTGGSKCLLSCHYGLVFTSNNLFLWKHLLWKFVGSDHSNPGANCTQYPPTATEQLDFMHPGMSAPLPSTDWPIL